METTTNFEAVNKWMFYCTNYDLKLFTRYNPFSGNENEDSDYAPSCMEVFEGSLRTHLIDKWRGYCTNNDGSGTKGLYDFYYGLDGGNREKLIEWVIKNYK